MAEQEDSSGTMAWLWREIEHCFGKEAANDLHRDYNDLVRTSAREKRLARDQGRLPFLHNRLNMAKQAGTSTRLIEQSIARIEQRLKEAGENHAREN